VFLRSIWHQHNVNVVDVIISSVARSPGISSRHLSRCLPRHWRYRATCLTTLTPFERAIRSHSTAARSICVPAGVQGSLWPAHTLPCRLAHYRIPLFTRRTCAGAWAPTGDAPPPHAAPLPAALQSGRAFILLSLLTAQQEGGRATWAAGATFRHMPTMGGGASRRR